MKNIKLFNENKIGIIFSKSLSFKESEKKKKKLPDLSELLIYVEPEDYITYELSLSVSRAFC